MDLTGLVGNTGPAAAIYYTMIVLISIFLGGFYLRNKLSSLCSESNKELVDRMTLMELKLKELEAEAVKIKTYEKDMSNVKDMFSDIKTDMRDGFASINKRIDMLLLNTPAN